MKPRPALRLGTRGSPLALAQVDLVKAALGGSGAAADAAIERHIIQTTGDRVQDRPLAEIGGKALWTKELDGALIDGRIDAGVHSMKDVETRLVPGIVLAAVLPRADARDRLVGAASLAALPPGARVGTSSPRRAAQLAHRRPDCEAVMLRGNVATRLAQVEAGGIDATFLAAAGLDRLGIEAGVALAIHDWLPAASQGVVGITARAGDVETLARLAAIDHGVTRAALAAERAVLAGLGGSCHTAVGVHASGGDMLTLAAELLSPDGRERVTASASGPATGAAELGAAVAAKLLAAATPAILASLEAA